MTCKCKMQQLLLIVCETIFGTQYTIARYCFWKFNTHLARSPCNIVVWSTAFVRVIICRIICWIIYYVYSLDFAVFSNVVRLTSNSCNFDLWFACNALLSFFFGRSQYIEMNFSLNNANIDKGKTRTISTKMLILSCAVLPACLFSYSTILEI